MNEVGSENDGWFVGRTYFENLVEYSFLLNCSLMSCFGLILKLLE